MPVAPGNEGEPEPVLNFVCEGLHNHLEMSAGSSDWCANTKRTNTEVARLVWRNTMIFNPSELEFVATRIGWLSVPFSWS